MRATGHKASPPSIDRSDGNGRYKEGNIQIACRFVDEFKRLSVLVRGGVRSLEPAETALEAAE